MKNRINLFWYQHGKGHGNFGDELNPYIVNKLSGLQVFYLNGNYLNDDSWIAFKTMTKELLRQKISLKIYLYYLLLNYIKKPKTIFAIGSILHSNHFKKNIIWGSGIIQSNDVFSNSNFLAVRGFHTIERIRKLGYPAPSVVGDPALLLPLILPSGHTKEFRIGIVPHYQHFEFFKSTFPKDILTINLLDSIEDIVRQINSCDIILSTSLHGIIVSHAYEIPALWVEFNELKDNKLLGDNVKFKDYFSSVNVPEYEPFTINIADIEDVTKMTIEKYNNVTLPLHEKIIKIQRNLLRVAPFNVLPKYDI